MKNSTKNVIVSAASVTAAGAVMYTGLYTTSILTCFAAACGQYKTALTVALTGIAVTYGLSYKAFDVVWDVVSDEIIVDDEYEKPILKEV